VLIGERTSKSLLKRYRELKDNPPPEDSSS
jgi:hypothetical protein